MQTVPFVNFHVSALFRFAVAFFFLFGWVTGYVHAQTTGIDSSIGIRLEPQFPQPEEEVVASIDAYSLDTTGAVIRWFLDGVELTASKDSRSVTIPAGKLGERKSLSATIQPMNGTAFTLRKEIAPTAVDIVVEAATHVPSFYRGRALPSGDSRVRVIAIPHIGNTDPRTLTYTWEQNGSVLFGGPIRGKQSADVLVSRYTGGYLTVSIYDTRGALVAKRNIGLEATAPELYFYEENPLRGLSMLSIRNNLSLIGEETTVHGEPYFLNKTGVETYSWKINGDSAVPTDDPRIITLRRTGAGGTANIGLEVVNDLGIPEFVRGTFSINF